MKTFVAIVLSLVIFVSTTSIPISVSPLSMSIKSVSEDYSEAIVLLEDGSLHHWKVYEAYDDIVVLEVNGEFHEYFYNTNN